ncbi:uncharacterized protein [Nicotiana sylvestris]|uniref:uncharacterized protein n=1 Tax=Nicotiana sylvestris TaxID=4096 RepID=UPI00388C6265
MVDEKVLLRVSPIKGVMQFGKKGKLCPRFIGPLEIFDRVGKVAYRLAFPPSLAVVHPVFYISVLRKYHEDKQHILDFSMIQRDENLSYAEEPVAILDRQVHKLRSTSFPSLKVQWSGQPIEEATWDSESDMQSRYPHHFISLGTFLCSFKDKRFF